MEKNDFDDMIKAIEGCENIGITEDIIFEGHVQRDADGKAVTQHGCAPNEIAMLASNIKKPSDWSGRIILLGSSTAELAYDVSRCYYELTNECVCVVGIKEDIIVEYINDTQATIGFGWHDDDPDKPEFIDSAKKDIYTIDKVALSIDNKFKCFYALHDNFFSAVLPFYNEDPAVLSNWFAQLAKIHKLLSKNLKELSFLAPNQELDDELLISWNDFVSKAKFILSSLIELSDKSKYNLTDDNDLDKLLYLNKSSDQIKSLQDDIVPSFLITADNLMRIFNLSLIKKTLDLSDPEMVASFTYNNLLERTE